MQSDSGKTMVITNNQLFYVAHVSHKEVVELNGAHAEQMSLKLVSGFL